MVATRMSIRVSEVENGYRAGVEDAVIIPLVAAALMAKAILRGVLWVLMRILDLSFPLLMQLIRFPLFTLRVSVRRRGCRRGSCGISRGP